MKKVLSFILCIFFTLTLVAGPNFVAGKKYKYVQLGDEQIGSIAINSDNKLFYNKSEILNDSSYWTMTREASTGYVKIRQGATRQYLFIENGELILKTNPFNPGNAVLFEFQLYLHNDKYYYAITPTISELKGKCIGLTEDGMIALKDFNPTANNLFLIVDPTNETPVEDTQIGGDITKFLNSFTLNGKPLVYDADNSLFFYSIKPEKFGTTFKLSVEYDQVEPSDLEIIINNTIINNGGEATFNNVTTDSEYEVEVKMGIFDLAKGKIKFSGLPMVQLYGNFGPNYSSGSWVIHDPSSMLPPSKQKTQVKFRGATAQNFAKKSYAVKLIDDNNNQVDKSYLGFREDNNWILDAMAIDNLRMRNRVCTDLWNDFSTPPYHKAMEPELINGTRGKFVEVFLNDQYVGLYCFTEKVDRKQLKLKKYSTTEKKIRGVLAKSTGWSTAVLMGASYSSGSINYFNNYSTYWEQFEMKYPDLTEEDPNWNYPTEITDWKTLYNAITFAARSSEKDFMTNVDQYFDVPLFLDYYLFIELMLATDNHGKNMYLYVYNQLENKKVSAAPWDLDGTFGIRWDGYTYYTRPDWDFPTFLKMYEHNDNYLFMRLRLMHNEKVKARYLELRETFFKPENLIARFAKYRQLFITSGAATREANRWNSYGMSMPRMFSIDEGFEYLKNWINSRIEVLDKQYGYISDVPTIKADIQLNAWPNPVIDQLNIEGITVGETIYIYDQHSRLVYQEKASANTHIVPFTEYEKGIYYVKVGAASAKIIKQ